jgi:glycosyltransferase involved in cell wall biosynthesis
VSERAPGGLRLLVTVTFNPNQLRAHLEPILALPEVASVTLVADSPGPALPKLRTVVPSHARARLLGRAAAKLVTCLSVARRERPDWVIGFNLVPHGINAAMTARLTRTKALYEMIGGAVEWEGGGWRSDNGVLGRLPRPVPPLESILLRVIRSCAVTVAMGENGRRALIDHGVSPDRAVTIPPAVDGARFRAVSISKRYQMLAVGSLIETKQTSDFVRAFARLSTSRPDVRAAIVGEGPLAPTLRAEAEQLGVSDGIDFLGFRPDIENIYADAEVYVQTSRYEALSIALLEAMASSLPVVASNVGETDAVVRDGANGYLVPVGDVETIASRVEALLADDELRNRLGDCAALDAREYADYPRVGALYRDLLLERGA